MLCEVIFVKICLRLEVGPGTRLLYFMNQMLAAMVLSQDRVSSSKTVRPRANSCDLYIRSPDITLSEVC